MVVMIPKWGGTHFRGIVLVEVPWKAISGIINCRLSSSIHFHDVMHGFRAGRGTSTTTLEAKLLQQFIDMRETVFHVIFLDLRKAYDALDRERCLDILAGCGVGPRTICILRTYWAQFQNAAKVGAIVGPPSRATAG